MRSNRSGRTTTAPTSPSASAWSKRAMRPKSASPTSIRRTLSRSAARASARSVRPRAPARSASKHPAAARACPTITAPRSAARWRRWAGACWRAPPRSCCASCSNNLAVRPAAPAPRHRDRGGSACCTHWESRNEAIRIRLHPRRQRRGNRQPAGPAWRGSENSRRRPVADGDAQYPPGAAGDAGRYLALPRSRLCPRRQGPAGHRRGRNRGTVCGSVAHADPSAELPLCLTALQGEVVLRSKAGRRVLKADQFFQGMLVTAVKPGEIVEEVRFPLREQGARYAFQEVSMRHGDFAIAALAAAVTNDAIELTVGGVADRPQRMRWPRLAGADLDGAINDFAWGLEAQSDAHASAEYRRHLVRRLGRQLITEASA